MIKYYKILISSSLNTISGIWLKFLFCHILLLFSFEGFHSEILMWKLLATPLLFLCLRSAVHKKKMLRSGRSLECKSESVGSRPGGVSFEIFNICRRSSTIVKVCQKSSIFMIKLSSGLQESFSDTRLNWSCVTRCGCWTTLSNFFTVFSPHKM